MRRHFPDSVDEFVWRDWNSAEPVKLPKIMGASVHDIEALAVSMGSPPESELPPEQKERGCITLI